MFFQLISDSVSIDRKIRFRVSPKTNIALKHLRFQLSGLLSLHYRGKTLVESQLMWNELAMMVLGKWTPLKEDEEGINVVVS